MVNIERKDNGAMVKISGSVEDIMYELGAGIDSIVETVFEHHGKDGAVQCYWDILQSVALNLLEKGIDVLEEDGEVEEDTVGQKILDALRDMKAADDDDGTEDDLPLF